MQPLPDLFGLIDVPAVRQAVTRQAKATAEAAKLMHEIAAEGNAAHHRERQAKADEEQALFDALAAGRAVNIADIGTRSKAAAADLKDWQRRHAIATRVAPALDHLIENAVYANAHDVLAWVARERAVLDAEWRASITEPGAIGYQNPHGVKPAGPLTDALPDIYAVVTGRICHEAGYQYDSWAVAPDRWPRFASWTLLDQFYKPEHFDAWEPGWAVLASGDWTIADERFVPGGRGPAPTAERQRSRVLAGRR